jgi:glutaredoxin
MNRLYEFCRALSEQLPQLRLHREADPGTKRPGIQIEGGITYRAVPEGPELDPFLAVFDPERPLDTEIDEAERKRLAEIHIPAEPKVYIAPGCPFCPMSVRRMLSLALASDQIHLEVVDALLFSEEAKAGEIRATPTIVLDADYRWSGNVSTAEVISALVDRNPVSLSSNAMARMIEEGGAFRLVHRFLEAKTVPPVFLDMLTHETLQVRLGAMAAMEEIEAQDPTLCTGVIDRLVWRLNNLDETVLGDAAYVIGELGGRSHLPAVKRVLKKVSRNDVRTAVEESITRLENRLTS